MKFSLHLEQPELSSRETSLVHLLLRLETPPVNEAGPHTPLLVALAIDRSKSMYGEKLQSVIEAANALVNWLTRNDSLAVIAYDTNVEVIQPLLPLTDKFSVMQRIESIHAGSSTNLSGGWLQALRMIEEVDDDIRSESEASESGSSPGHQTSAGKPPAFRRVILLTDGMANAGIVRPAELKGIARDHFQRGISTTTMGFGRDFSEQLLSGIAAEGGGNFYFIEGPEQASTVFFQEFGEIAALYGQGLELQLHFGPGVHLKELLNEIPHELHDEKDGQHLILRPGDLRSDDLMNLVLVLEIDGAQLSATDRPLVHAECSFYNLREGARMQRQSLDLRPTLVGTPTGLADHDVQLEAVVASTGRVLLEASRLSAERDLGAARELIRRMRRRIEESMELEPELLHRLHERLGVTERNLDENLNVLSKRLMAEAESIQRRGDLRRQAGAHDHILDLSLSGQLDLYRCPELKASVRRAIENGFRFAVIDMTELSYVDSSGIGALIQVFNWLKNRGGLLVLSNIQGSVERIFQMSKLDEFFVFRDSQASARLLIEELLAEQPG